MENAYIRNYSGWSTTDEIKVIDYIASDEKRIGSGNTPTLEQRRNKVLAWIETSKKRIWNDAVDAYKCRTHAMKLYENLGVEQ